MLQLQEDGKDGAGSGADEMSEKSEEAEQRARTTKEAVDAKGKAVCTPHDALLPLLWRSAHRGMASWLLQGFLGRVFLAAMGMDECCELLRRLALVELAAYMARNQIAVHWEGCC
jgi:predicted methyltransferase MtxX (methanogen marker protein 4)